MCLFCLMVNLVRQQKILYWLLLGDETQLMAGGGGPRGVMVKAMDCGILYLCTTR